MKNRKVNSAENQGFDAENLTGELTPVDGGNWIADVLPVLFRWYKGERNVVSTGAVIAETRTVRTSAWQRDLSNQNLFPDTKLQSL